MTISGKLMPLILYVYLKIQFVSISFLKTSIDLYRKYDTKYTYNSKDLKNINLWLF